MVKHLLLKRLEKCAKQSALTPNNATGVAGFVNDHSEQCSL